MMAASQSGPPKVNIADLARAKSAITVKAEIGIKIWWM
jgi:hypothetical protein